MEHKIRQYCVEQMRKAPSVVSVCMQDAKECVAILDRKVAMVFVLQETADSMDTDMDIDDKIEIAAAYRVTPEYTDKEISIILDIKTEYEYEVIKKCIAVVFHDHSMQVVLTRERNMDIYILESSGDDDDEKAAIITILQQPTAVLNRFIHNFVYLWIFYASKVQLVYFRLASQPKIHPLFHIDTTNIGTYHSKVCELLTSSNGEGTLLALYFECGDEIRVYAVDTRYALWQAEKKRTSNSGLASTVSTTSRIMTKSRSQPSSGELNYSCINVDSTITPLVVKIPYGQRINSIGIDPMSICAYTRGTYHDYRFPYSFRVVADSDQGHTITQAIVSAEQYLINFMVNKGVECLVKTNPYITLDTPDRYLQVADKKSIITSAKDATMADCNTACVASALWVRPLNEDILREKKVPRNIFLLETLLATGHARIIADYINHKNNAGADYALTDYARVYNWAVGDDARFSYKAYLQNEISNFNLKSVLPLLLDKDVFSPSTNSKLHSRNVPISTMMFLQQMYNLCSGLGVVMWGLITRQNDSFSGEADMKRLYMLGLQKNLMEVEALQRLAHMLSTLAQDTSITLATISNTCEGPIYKALTQNFMEIYQSFDQNASAALKANLSYSQLAGDNTKKVEDLNKLFFLPHSIIASVSKIESVESLHTILRLLDCSDGLLLYFIGHMYYDSIARRNTDKLLVPKLDKFYHNFSDSLDTNKSTAALMLALLKIDKNIDVTAAVQCLCDERINVECGYIVHTESMFKVIASTLLNNNCHHELYLLLNTCKSYYSDCIKWDVFMQYFCDSLTKSTTWVSGVQIARRFCNSLSNDIVMHAKQVVIRRFFEYAKSIKSLPHFLTQVAMDEIEITAIYKNFCELIDADCKANKLKSPHIDIAFYWLLRLNRVDLAWGLHEDFDKYVGNITDSDSEISNFRNARISAYNEYKLHPFFRVN